MEARDVTAAISVTELGKEGSGMLMTWQRRLTIKLKVPVDAYSSPLLMVVTD